MSFLPIMSEFLKQTSHNIIIEERIQQMDKGQDQTYSGEGIDIKSGKVFKYAMVTDGHGKNDCIDCLRGIQKSEMATILGKEDPVQVLAEYIHSKINRCNPSGATMCLAKIFDDHIVCINCGDSQVAVFKDGALVHLSKEHNYENAEERARLLVMDCGITFEESRGIKVISPSKMVGAYCEYAAWPDGQQLACTQALGNKMRTGYAPDYISIPIEPGSNYKVLIGSDGVWDMVIKEDTEDILRFVSMNADEALAFVKGRWLQEWTISTYDEPEKEEKMKYIPKYCDDISLVMIDIKPV